MGKNNKRYRPSVNNIGKNIRRVSSFERNIIKLYYETRTENVYVNDKTSGRFWVKWEQLASQARTTTEKSLFLESFACRIRYKHQEKIIKFQQKSFLKILRSWIEEALAVMKSNSSHREQKDSRDLIIMILDCIRILPITAGHLTKQTQNMLTKIADVAKSLKTETVFSETEVLQLEKRAIEIPKEWRRQFNSFHKQKDKIFQPIHIEGCEVVYMQLPSSRKPKVSSKSKTEDATLLSNDLRRKLVAVKQSSSNP